MTNSNGVNEYTLIRSRDSIQSSAFPELNLTAEQIFQAAL